MTQIAMFDIPPRMLSTNRLEEFCDYFIEKHQASAPIQPEELAERFSEFFRISPPVELRDEIRLAKRLGIQNFQLSDLPEGISGFNAKLDNAYTLYIRRMDHRIRQEHTVFHELHELIVARICEVSSAHGRCFPDPRSIQAEHDADRFAASVLMPSHCFAKDAIESGLDIVALRKRYGRSYSSVLIHVARTMTRLKIPFVGWLYEENLKEPRQTGELRLAYRWAVLGLSNRSNPVLASYIPRRGDRVVSEGLARLANGYREPVYIGRATEFDFFGLDDLTLLARPVVWGESNVAKIVVIGVRWEQREILEPQLVDIDARLIPRVSGLNVPDAFFDTDQLTLPLSAWHRARDQARLPI